jgi:hypothetical protein
VSGWAGGLIPNHQQHGTPSQWLDYWWHRRAEALIAIDQWTRVVEECNKFMGELATPSDREGV